MTKEMLGLRSEEDYVDPKEVDRIAVIYGGLRGKGVFIRYSKGDDEGNRWDSNQSLYIDWTEEAVGQLQTLKTARWQGHRFFLTPGVSWSDTGNHVALKSRFLPVSVNDVKSMRLSPIIPALSAEAFMAVLNSDVFSFLEKKFINHTCMYQINDLRQIPIVIPTPEQETELADLARQCMALKRASFAKQSLDQELVAEVRAWAKRLATEAPAYLHPGAQLTFATGPEDCLIVLERAVSWCAERLYGVEGQGPFDDF